MRYYMLIAHEAIFRHRIVHASLPSKRVEDEWPSANDINSINSTEINNMFTCVALNSISLLAVENKLPCVCAARKKPRNLYK